MIDSLITSKTRIKLLLKFFLNNLAQGYLRNLEAEFGESSNAIRIELNRLEGAGLLISHKESNKKIYQANTNHPLYKDIKSIVEKIIGLDQIRLNIASKTENLQVAFITGKLASGQNSGIIELALIGNNLDRSDIAKLVDNTEVIIKRKIQFVILKKEEFNQFMSHESHLQIWPE